MDYFVVNLHIIMQHTTRLLSQGISFLASSFDLSCIAYCGTFLDLQLQWTSSFGTTLWQLLETDIMCET